jgi:hypothetical protein
MTKHKFSKRKCKRCIYHSAQSGGYLICSYATRNKEDHTCLYKGTDGKLHDRRGDDYHNCLLFVEGQPIREKRVY